MTEKAVRFGTDLTPGKWYRITQLDPTDDSPTMSVGDVARCSANPVARELDPEFNDDTGSWFADLQDDNAPGFGTLVTGLVEVPEPAS